MILFLKSIILPIKQLKMKSVNGLIYFTIMIAILYVCILNILTMICIFTVYSGS